MDIVNLKSGEIITISRDVYIELYNRDLIFTMESYDEYVFVNRNRWKIIFIKTIISSILYKNIQDIGVNISYFFDEHGGVILSMTLLVLLFVLMLLIVYFNN